MIFHIDLDAFYASVEIRDNPLLKEKVVLICGKSNRSVVTTCNYKAREYGIRSAMPLFKALELYKDPVIIKPRFSYYKEISNQVMDIFYSFTDKVYQLSIDEAFLDLSHSKNLYPSAKVAAKLIKDKIKTKVGITCSIGISNKFYISKMASNYRKPDGLTIINDNNIIKFIDLLGINKLWGFGEKSKKIFKQKGIYSTEIARKYKKEDLQNKLGTHLGSFLYSACRGDDYIDFTSKAKNKSLSKETTLGKNEEDKNILLKIIFDLCKETYFELLDKNYKAKSLGVKIKYSNFTSVTKQTTLPTNINLDLIYKISKDLFLEKWTKQPIRLIGISFNNLYNRNIQANLFDDSNEQKKSKIDYLALEMSKKGNILTKASLIKKNN